MLEVWTAAPLSRNPAVDIRLSASNVQFLETELAEGQYPSASAAVDAALALLRRHSALRRKLHRSAEQFERGEYLEFESDEALDDYFRSVFGPDCLEDDQQ